MSCRRYGSKPTIALWLLIAIADLAMLVAAIGPVTMVLILAGLTVLAGAVVAARTFALRPVDPRPVGARPVGPRPMSARPVGVRPVGAREVVARRRA
jgi:hypothetical protein